MKQNFTTAQDAVGSWENSSGGAQKAVLNNCPKPVPHLVLGQGAAAPAPRLATLPSQMARRAPGPGAGGGGGQSLSWYSHRAVA